MKRASFLISILTCVCLILLICGGNALCSESYLPNAGLKYRVIQANFDYPDNTVLGYPALVPLSGYSTEKGRSLAKQHKTQLIQIIKNLKDKYPFAQMEIRAVGFLKSPHCGEKDERYLSVIFEIGEKDEMGKGSFKKRAGAVFKKYIDPIAMILLKWETVLDDKRVAGVAVCPNWMLNQKTSDKTKMSEGLFVCINSKAGKEFFQGKISLSQLATQSKIYARQGDKIFDLVDIQLKN